jgi:opacity protein-like surface antigen
MNVSLGASYVSMGMTPSPRVGLNGLDASVEASFLRRIGLKLDVGYARAWNVLGSGRHSDVLSYLGGPVIHLSRREGFTAYVQGLVGGARVTGVVPLTGGGFGGGYANKPAWCAGLGAEYRFSDGLAFRAGGDYLHTTFFSPSGTLQGQTDFRAVSSVVYYFGNSRY